MRVVNVEHRFQNRGNACGQGIESRVKLMSVGLPMNIQPASQSLIRKSVFATNLAAFRPYLSDLTLDRCANSFT